ncbi:hypothetical protein GFC01_05610 [Desulfofundulus thermobenzoicus]|uniref:Uncharacterized protein n=1 Tax=Desulfofundulus thermobenzoicus TaxID=29376 RepID=A0A6N7INZ0_9FIRM|nr:hypothetical protein [Desulfofundulus thermobenzoicus]MQL51745.1 hypothetical protein [Desulfofundulus thermobenzoicus]HHW44970.1 hypothetical protein [Desulfotomaculum sp.]
MRFKVIARVSEDLSSDPSYIVHYQIFERGQLLGDGTIQVHRQARANDLELPESMRCLDGSPLPPDVQQAWREKITGAVWPYLQETIR